MLLLSELDLLHLRDNLVDAYLHLEIHSCEFLKRRLHFFFLGYFYRLTWLKSLAIGRRFFHRRR